MGTQVSIQPGQGERKTMKESTLAISLLCLGCFLSIHKVSGFGAVSGFGSCPASYIYKVGQVYGYVQFPWGRLRSISSVDNIDACANHCKANSKCCSFTYFPRRNKRCDLNSECQSTANGYWGPRDEYYMCVKGESERDYPDVVSIWNTDPDANVLSVHKTCLGQYSKMPGKSSHGKPVWKHIDRGDRFFFMGKDKLWYCGPFYGAKKNIGTISAIRTMGPQPWTIYGGAKSIEYFHSYSQRPKSFLIEGTNI